MVAKLTIIIAFLIEFHLNKLIKVPLNQRFSRSLAGRAPPCQSEGRWLEANRDQNKKSL